MKKISIPLLAAWILLTFNLWHNSIRGVWNFSVRDSLTMGENVMPLAQSVDPKIRSYKPYDGQFYYALAFDPLLLSGKSIPFIDVPRYRCKRLMYPLLAWILSANDPHRLPVTLLLVNLASWFLIGYASAKIAVSLRVSPVFLVSLVMTITGLTFSVFRTLTEPLGFALALWGCYFWEADRKTAAVMLFSLSGLAREIMLSVPLAIFAYEILFRKKSARESLMLFFSFLPLAIWSAYLSRRLPPEPYNGLRWISLPFIGFIRESLLALQVNSTSTELQRSLSIILATGLLTITAAWQFIKIKSLWGWLALTQGIMAFLVHGDIWNYHASSSRVIILLMAFSGIFFLELHAREEQPPFT